MTRLFVLVLLSVYLQGCVALNVPRPQARQPGGDQWVYPDPSWVRLELSAPPPKDESFRGLKEWASDGKEEWRGLKDFTRVLFRGME